MPASKDAKPLGQAVEDYAKAIYALEAASADGTASTTALADRVGVTPASASAMVKRLDALGLVTNVPYHGFRLTEAGNRVALEMLRHHRLLELFLAEELGMPWDRVHDEAEVLEHVLSDELEQLIAVKLGEPRWDPHGDPIPTITGEITEVATQAIATMNVGASGRLSRISDTDPEVLRYLSERGIALGDRFEVVGRQPFDGPTFVRFEGAEESQALGGRLAFAMHAEVDPSRRLS